VLNFSRTVGALDLLKILEDLRKIPSFRKPLKNP
jgi:hypothetical protein